ncbi:MAG: helix-turn-helix domain-containing protein [Bacteroidetes bacterium]|nr:helix-turn-helix domain-containing protein [Bacteroidota bacterium]
MKSNEIKNIRQNILKLSQEEFSQLLSVSTKTISRWENGESEPTGLSLQNLLKLKSVINDKNSLDTLKKTLVGSTGIAIGSMILGPLAGIIAISATAIGPSVLKLFSSLINKKIKE